MTQFNTLLFVPAPIASHLVPALALAKRLKQYRIIFAVASAYIEEVKQAGFDAYALDAPRFGIGDDPYILQLSEYDKSPSYWREIKFYFSNNVYNQREIAIKKIIKIVHPDGVLLDLFSSTDFIIFYPYVKHIIFVSPMLSTHKVKGFPLFNEEQWTKMPLLSYLQYLTSYINPRIVYDVFNGFNGSLIRWYNFLRNRIPLTYSAGRSASGLIHFRNKPEILLAPLELEFSKAIKGKHQHYLGLVVDESRVDTGVDPLFEVQYAELCNRKKTTKLIYCSFGTYGISHEIVELLCKFINQLLKALTSISGVTVVLAVIPPVKAFLSNIEPWPENVFVYAKVPQLQMLALADLFITHAGLGSIKEAIHFGVPLLAFPLDPDWDQDGNALKIEYHKLGMRGSMHDATAQTLATQINVLLTKDFYRNNIKKLQQKLMLEYPEGCEEATIKKLL